VIRAEAIVERSFCRLPIYDYYAIAPDPAKKKCKKNAESSSSPLKK